LNNEGRLRFEERRKLHKRGAHARAKKGIKREFAEVNLVAGIEYKINERQTHSQQSIAIVSGKNFNWFNFIPLLRHSTGFQCSRLMNHLPR